jgi:hypothetical protein
MTLHSNIAACKIDQILTCVKNQERESKAIAKTQEMTLHSNTAVHELDSTLPVKNRAQSARSGRSNEVREVMSTPAGSNVQGSTSQQLQPRSVEARPAVRQQYNLRSWITKGAESASNKSSDSRARCGTT